MDSNFLLEQIKDNTARLVTLLESRSVIPVILSTTGSGTLKAGFSKASFISGGSATTLTISGTTITCVQNRAYIFGADKNDIIAKDIAYNANGDTLQILIEYGGSL